MSPFRIALVLIAAASLGRADVVVKELPDRVRIEIDGQLFTEYRFTGAPHVYYWPLIGPGGAKITRAWPMEEAPGEERDHPHHRSMWFSHGLVNGVDFWSEEASHGGKPQKIPIGKIVHDRVIAATSGAEEGELTSAQRWVAPDGSVPLTSLQTLRVYRSTEREREFDFEVTLSAAESDVTFGDTKEGTFGMRIAESMRMKGPQNAAGAGQMINSEGLKGDRVWGNHAKWVDMYGPVDGKVMGIAIFEHPSTPRSPTRWHARDYGLFAANPFCEHEMDKTKPQGAGDWKLAAGKSATFRYHVLIHEGEPDFKSIDECSRRYENTAVGDAAATPPPP